MHLLETYAVSTGCSVDKCFLHEEKIDLPDSPYITIHSHNPKGPGRQYKYWQDVVDHLKSHSKFNLEIIQIGGLLDERLKHINTSYLGKTNYHSLSYLIKNSVLHIGFDSLPIHIASHHNIKIVAIYAHYANNTRPYFSDPENIVLLEPDHSKIKPVFSNIDPFDQINSIPPSYIIDGIHKLLNL